MMYAAFAAVNLWSMKVTEVDKVPWEKYMSVIRFDKQTNTLTFYDNYREGDMIKRVYTVEFYYREVDSNGNTLNRNLKLEESGEDPLYIYGVKSGSNFCQETREYAEGHKGFLQKTVDKGYFDGKGEVSINLKNEISQCIAAGSLQIHIAIMGREVAADGLTTMSFENTGKGKRSRFFGSHLNNAIDVDLSAERFNVLAIFCNNVAYYGYDFEVEAQIQGFGQTNYYLQRSADKVMWQTIETGNIISNHTKKGKALLFKLPFNENGAPSVYYYRLIAQDVNTGFSDTTQVESVKYVYNCWYNGINYVREAGETFKLAKPSDCLKYKVISDFPVQRKTVGDYIEFTQPACNVEIVQDTLLYVVRFLDREYNLLKLEIVQCGSDATAPDAPLIEGYTFREWSNDITNVHKDMSVIPLYDMGDNYVFTDKMLQHKNERYYVHGFSGDEHRAMLGDSITFSAEVRTPALSTLSYETAMRDAQGEWQWSGKITAGTYTDEDAQKGSPVVFNKTVAVAYDYGNEMAFRNGFAFRFCLSSAGTIIYSKPYEFELYYPITVNSEIELQDGTLEAIFATNSDGDVAMGANCLIPARDKDTIRISRLNNNAGGCLSFARVNKPQSQYAVTDGLDDNGKAYFICPGETETVNVKVNKMVVVFDGATPTTYYDFTSQGVNFKGNAYYAEVVNCGGSIKTIPNNPDDGKSTIFKGWQAWGDYADDAYLNVPATGDPYIGFTAQWDDLPDAVYYTVNFYARDGQTLIASEQVEEGQNAVAPDESKIPVIEGYHFTGWDKSFNVVTEDMDVIAIYGEDNKTWIVTYYDATFWPTGFASIGTEIVNDGEAALQKIVPDAVHEGYMFAFWSINTTNRCDLIRPTDEVADLSHVTSDIRVYSRWKKAEYTITYTINGVEIFSEQVAHGDMPSAYKAIEDQGIPSTDQFTYTFDHWNPAIEAATKDAVYEAVFTESLRKFNVVFQNWDHSFIEEQQVEYGKQAKEPAQQPIRDGYAFTGWDRDISNVITDMVATALFEKQSPLKQYFTLTLLADPAEGGVVAGGGIYEAGKMVSINATPNDGYEFIGWSDGVEEAARQLSLESDLTLTASFQFLESGLDEMEHGTNSKTQSPKKMLRGGHLYIIMPNGKEYSATGEAVK